VFLHTDEAGLLNWLLHLLEFERPHSMPSLKGKLHRETANYFTVIHDLASKADTWKSRPAWLEFAPNNICNLRCIMCSQADGLPVRRMERETAAELLDQVLPHTSLLTPSALSEPMLADIDLILAKCEQHDVFLNFHTNATLLDGECFRKLAPRLHKLWISLDSPVPDVFEKIRAGASFEKVVQNVREILPIAVELNVPVGFVAVFMRENAAHVDQLVDLIADLGGTEARSDLRLQAMLDNAVSCPDSDPFGHFDTTDLAGFLDAAVERARIRGISFLADLPEPHRRSETVSQPRVRGIAADLLVRLIEATQEMYPDFCHMAATYAKIEPDGEVYPCCRAPVELRMGNIKDQSFEEIWNGDRYQAFRRRMFAKDYPDTCRTCSVLTLNPHFRATSKTPYAPGGPSSVPGTGGRST
jgi:radical SAM protein with 4Fe4S-binding SPASM domain